LLLVFALVTTSTGKYTILESKAFTMKFAAAATVAFAASASAFAPAPAADVSSQSDGSGIVDCEFSQGML